jgi:hypothetical protein
MPLTAADIKEIDALLGAPEADAAAVAALKARLPRFSLTRADASDLGADTPFRQYPRFDLYLVDGRSHCWTLTSDPQLATGLVVAARRSAP